uniref:Protein kinase domain-containing protein n=1 Tax=Angiostrongylus cantonensis TaxID=6313 RepID=A0A0K0DFC3_ANGCA
MFGSNRPPEQIVPRSDGTYKLTKKVDVWGLGSVVYQMRYGKKPFADCSENPMIAVLDPNVRLQHEIGADPAMTEFLEMCTVRDVQNRATIDQLLAHRYLAQVCSQNFFQTKQTKQEAE